MREHPSLTDKVLFSIRVHPATILGHGACGRYRETNALYKPRCDKIKGLKALFVERLVGGLDALTFTISASFLVLLMLADYTLSIFDKKEVAMDGEHGFFKSVLRVVLLVGVEAQGAASNAD